MIRAPIDRIQPCTHPPFGSTTKKKNMSPSPQETPRWKVAVIAIGAAACVAILAIIYVCYNIRASQKDHARRLQEQEDRKRRRNAVDAEPVVEEHVELAEIVADVALESGLSNHHPDDHPQRQG